MAGVDFLVFGDVGEDAGRNTAVLVGLHIFLYFRPVTTFLKHHHLAIISDLYDSFFELGLG